MIVGYRLLDENGNVMQQWGGTWGRCPGLPNPLRLPNGDHVHAPLLDTDYSGFRLVAWEMDEPAQPVPESITRRQCARQLLALGMITGPEAVEMTRAGTPPAAIQAFFDALPDEGHKTLAEIDFAAGTYVRGNALIAALMAANGMSEEQADDFFRIAATL